MQAIIIEQPVAHRRLGRLINHDERSKAFPAARASGPLRSVMHKRLVPIFDQGDRGSCTGNAGVGCISTEPFGYAGDEANAVDVYSAATRVDNIAGHYPPTDTGSSGLAVAKVLKTRGLIGGYGHVFSLDHFLHALMLGPGMCGMTWLDGCDTPDENGVVSYSGGVRGGHEIEAVGLDVVQKLVWFANSWGPNWAKGGYFAMKFYDLGAALKDRGDGTFPTLPA